MESGVLTNPAVEEWVWSGVRNLREAGWGPAKQGEAPWAAGLELLEGTGGGLFVSGSFFMSD